jgi:hypothetical protein
MEKKYIGSRDPGAPVPVFELRYRYVLVELPSCPKQVVLRYSYPVNC